MKETKQNWKNQVVNVIDVPHLNYKVRYGVYREEFVGPQEKTVMFAENTSKNIGTIFFRKKPTTLESATVAHEVMHVLQFMCRRRNIVMENETEHMGYLMQYIFNEIYNRKYKF